MTSTLDPSLATSPEDQKPGQASLLREVAGVFSSRIVMLITMFGTGVIIARFLGAEGKGIYAALVVYPELLLTLVGGGIWQAAVYQLGQGEHDRRDIVSSVTWFIFAASALGVAVCAALYAVLDNPDFTPWLMIGALALIPVKVVTSYTGGVLLGLKDTPGYNRTLWLTPLVRFVAVLAFVVMASWQVAGAVAATFIASGVTATVGLIAMYRHVPLRFSFASAVARQQVTLGSVYAVSLFVRTLNYRADIVVLDRLASASEVGQYTVGVSLAELLWQLPTALGVVVFSRSAYAKGSADFTVQIARLLRVTLILATVGSVGLAVVAGVLVPLMYGDDFGPSATVIRWLLPGVVAFVVLKVCSMDLAGRGKPQMVVYVTGPTVVLNLALNFWWVPLLGITGAALASTVSYLVAAVAYLMVYARTVKMPLAVLLRPQRSDFEFVGRMLTKLRNR